MTILFPELTLPLFRGTGNGDKGNEGSGNEVDRVTVEEGEARVNYRAEKSRANNLIGLKHMC